LLRERARLVEVVDGRLEVGVARLLLALVIVAPRRRELVRGAALGTKKLGAPEAAFDRPLHGGRLDGPAGDGERDQGEEEESQEDPRDSDDASAHYPWRGIRKSSKQRGMRIFVALAVLALSAPGAAAAAEDPST